MRLCKECQGSHNERAARSQGTSHSGNTIRNGLVMIPKAEISLWENLEENHALFSSES